MTIISSQQYLDDGIVDKKIAELEKVKAQSITVPCYYVGIIDGVEYAMQADCHHTLAAARELGLDINFDIKSDPEGLGGEEMLEIRHLGDDWYKVESSNPYYCEIDLVW